MILTSHAIRHSLSGRNPAGQRDCIQIAPLPAEDAWNPTSVDLTLGDTFYRPNSNRLPSPSWTYEPDPVDLSAPRECLWASLETLMGDPITAPNGIVLLPACSLLGSTVEHITIPSWATGQVDGRSILGRFGLQVHLTACHCHPKWAGNLVLEFYNSGVAPLLLKPGMKICTLYFHLNYGGHPH